MKKKYIKKITVMFLVTFIQYRPDMHARWVQTACVLETA